MLKDISEHIYTLKAHQKVRVSRLNKFQKNQVLIQSKNIQQLSPLSYAYLYSITPPCSYLSPFDTKPQEKGQG